jgi:hypothetical protein
MGAVLGLRVSEAWWLAACREIQTQPPEGLIAHLTQRGLTRPDPQRGDPGWAFSDGRVRAAALRRADRHERRRRMHSVVADLLPNDDPARATHLLQCGRVHEARARRVDGTRETPSIHASRC